MSDDDDWVGGEPPEGRHTRDQANAAYWRNQWQPLAIAGAVVLVLIIVVLVLTLS